ncbi:MAG: ATP-binding protein [Bacilli bacterium]|nr:ATP-binding protein [Bacilli bacterium]
MKRTNTPCAKVVLRMKRDSRYLMSDFPSEWKDKSFHDVDISEARRKTLTRLFSAQKNGKWFYLSGPFNRGKSNILACFANDFAEKSNSTVAFADTAKLIDRLRGDSIKNKEAFSQAMKELVEVPLLVLDGFGNEYKSDFAFSTVLFPLLGERARAKKLTLFASDFSYDEIASMYVSSVGAPRANQLVALIHSMCGKEAVLDALNVY